MPCRIWEIVSTRKVVYLCFVGLATLIFSAPQGLFGIMLATEYARTGDWPLPDFPGFSDSTMYFSHYLQGAPLWNDRFIHIQYASASSDGSLQWKPISTDPETGEAKELEFTVPGSDGFTARVIGNNLWFVGSSESHVLESGSLRPSKLNYRLVHVNNLFQFDGKVAQVQFAGRKWVLSVFESDKWTGEREVLFPSGKSSWNIDGVLVAFDQCNEVKVLNHGDDQHVFVRCSGQLLHRVGLKLGDPVQVPGRPVKQMETDLPASAFDVENPESQLAGWSRIANEPESQISWFPMLVDGKPAVFRIDNVNLDSPIGEALVLDGSTWKTLATKQFPFGAKQFHVVSKSNGQTAYVVVSTSIGHAYFYAVEANGIRTVTPRQQAWTNPMKSELLFYVFLPISTLVLGILLGLCVWPLMWVFTKPQYEFGIRSVKLASVGRRGLARLIDQLLLGGIPAAVGWLVTRDLDWDTFCEAMNMRADHPTISQAQNALLTMLASGVAMAFGMILLQGLWGVTPGKWCCGIRTQLSTLKPCGFARSLLRETLMCIDCCNLLLWTPAILSIALTERRQRLGDKVADTIVVEARSLTTAPTSIHSHA